MASWYFAQDRGIAAPKIIKIKPAQITAKTMTFFQQNCQNLFSFRSTHLAVNSNKYEKILTWFNAPFTIILLSSLVREALRRQGLKVVFFGRTSCGKSTLINALLGEPALPTGLGIYQYKKKKRIPRFCCCWDWLHRPLLCKQLKAKPLSAS